MNDVSNNDSDDVDPDATDQVAILPDDYWEPVRQDPDEGGVEQESSDDDAAGPPA